MSELDLLPVVPTTGLAPLVALGDSVMLGAAEELGAIGFAVDARQNRQLGEFVATMRSLRNDNVFGSVVVFHLGTNGSFNDRELAAAMDALSEVPVVLVLTGKADRGWIAGNNELLRALPATYPNVTVLDWERLASACEGTCFYEDRIHLAPAGQRFYTSLIAGTLGL
jgi:hypothetical protein